MKLYILNLKKDIERKKHVISLLNKYNIINYKFCEAVYGKELQNVDRFYDYNCTNSNLYNDKKLNLGALGCALSHINMYKDILKEKKRVLILEDDITFDETLLQQLKDIPEKINNNSRNVIFYNATGVQKTKMKGNYDNYEIFEYIQPHESYCTSVLVFDGVEYNGLKRIAKEYVKNEDIYGTFAYSPSKAFCKKAIEIQTPVKYRADYIWNLVSNTDIYFNIHQPIQIHEELGLLSNIDNYWLKERLR